MRPKESTISVLMDLVREAFINEKTVLLYLYYCTCENKAPTRTEVSKATWLAIPTIRTHEKVLIALGALKLTREGRVYRVETFDITKPTTRGVYTTITNILNIQSQKYILNTKYSTINSKGSLKNDNSIYRILKGGYGRLSSEDLPTDPDFLRAKKELLKYFKEFELDLVSLTRKRRFERLVEILDEKGFNFSGYCKWYAENKYKGRGFNFGLFLYPNVIAEYRYYLAHPEDDTYHRTKDTLAKSESFKAGVKKTKDFLKNLEDG